MTLLATMVAVAVTLWEWPSDARPPRDRSVRTDVVLPAVPDARPVAAAAALTTEPSNAAVERVRQVLAPAPPPPDVPLWSRHPRLPMLRPTAVPAQSAAASNTAAVLRAAVDAHPLPVVLQPAPAAPAGPSAAPADSANPAHALARAGVALGGAFRKAGVNTAAAFTRIF
jgi:hypothetical protein